VDRSYGISITWSSYVPSRYPSPGFVCQVNGDRIITRIHEKIRIYSSSTGHELLSFDALRVVTGMQVAGEWLVEHSPREIGIWDVNTGMRICELTPGLLNIAAVCIGCGGGTIAAACWDHTSTNQLLCWNVADNSLVFSVIIAKCTALTLSPFSSNFIVFSQTDEMVHEYDATTGEKISHSAAFIRHFKLLVAAKTGSILM
jgi:WD40 repeat protein